MLKFQKIITGMMMFMMMLGSMSMLVSEPASAAPGQLNPSDLGIDQPAATGLPNKDVREVVAYIIRVILGLLDTICVVIIYTLDFCI